MAHRTTEHPRSMETVAEALDALAHAYLQDWSGMDGRWVQFEMERLALAIRAGGMTAPELAAFAVTRDLCLRCHRWTEHCTCGGES